MQKSHARLNVQVSHIKRDFGIGVMDTNSSDAIYKQKISRTDFFYDCGTVFSGIEIIRTLRNHDGNANEDVT